MWAVKPYEIKWPADVLRTLRLLETVKAAVGRLTVHLNPLRILFVELPNFEYREHISEVVHGKIRTQEAGQP